MEKYEIIIKVIRIIISVIMGGATAFIIEGIEYKREKMLKVSFIVFTVAVFLFILNFFLSKKY